MTRFQFRPESNRKQKRADRLEKLRDEGLREPGAESAEHGERGAGRGRNSRGKSAAPHGSPIPAAAPSVKDAFSALIREVATEKGLGPKLDPEPAPLALLDYDTEIELKTESVRKWWTQHNLPDKPTRVVPSPLPRHYRSTSKRRLVRRGDQWRWDFFLERLGGAAKAGIDALEPASHEAIYKLALEKLNEDSYRPLAASLNFLIVRGGDELMVVFNVFRLNADVVRKAGLLAGHLERAFGSKAGSSGVKAAHIFYDKTRSDYYIESRVSEGAFRVKTLFGPEFLPVTVSGRRYLLHPTGFFQVNLSILPRVLDEVINALKPLKTDRLVDLYCGCGLFTLPAAAMCAQAYGIEGSSISIDAAGRAAGAARARNVRFTAGRIDSKSLLRMLPPPDDTPEILLLDPPRQGTAPGVIPLLASRKPRRVAYLFCDMNVMPAEIDRWRRQGYMVAKAVPFDMFPGTNNLEMLVVLIPDKYGILNRKKVKVDAVDEEETGAGRSERGAKARPGKKAPPRKTGYTPKNRRG
jgi:tRNA/tmRNA/rRNA uracil-C5-methylase (TrmA/RlmC/RlmD family)